jgi:hypothetical protein
MTTELVILLALFVTVIVGVFKTPAETFDNAGPRLGMRIEKQLETGSGFSDRTQNAPQAVRWSRKN